MCCGDCVVFNFVWCSYEAEVADDTFSEESERLVTTDDDEYVDESDPVFSYPFMGGTESNDDVDSVFDRDEGEAQRSSWAGGWILRPSASDARRRSVVSGNWQELFEVWKSESFRCGLELGSANSGSHLVHHLCTVGYSSPIEFLVDSGSDWNLVSPADWKVLRDARRAGGVVLYGVTEKPRAFAKAYGLLKPLEVVRSFYAWTEVLQSCKPRNFAKFYVVESGTKSILSAYIKSFSDIAKPLWDATISGQFVWRSEQESSFQALKEAIAACTVQQGFFSGTDDTFLYTDASPVALGADLVQKNPQGDFRTISFASRLLSQTERRYPQTQREALSIVWGAEHFWYYLLGRKFTVRTMLREFRLF